MFCGTVFETLPTSLLNYHQLPSKFFFGQCTSVIISNKAKRPQDNFQTSRKSSKITFNNDVHFFDQKERKNNLNSVKPW